MSHWRSQLDNYHGSTILQPVSNVLGIQVDKLNFLAAGLFSVALGYAYSRALPVTRTPVAVRKLSVIVGGLSVLYFCFGRDLMHIVAEASIGFILMNVMPLDNLPLTTIVVALFYQSVCHLVRQYTDPDGYTIDITGPLMMLTQRVSTLAFSLRDGATPEKELTVDQRRDAIKTKPDLLSYFAYMLDFHEILAGPLIPYNEFLRIAEEPEDERQPTPHWEVGRKLVYVLMNAALIMFAVPRLTDKEILSDWYHNLPFLKKIFYLNIFSCLSRVQYYLVWKLAEAVCNSSGYGYYKKSNGAECWDGADNIHIFQLETASSLKVILDNWNVSTQKWLKHVCYDRKVNSKTALTFFVSAIWHGFYPGYFLSFMSCALFVQAARTMRRCIRHRVVHNGFTEKLYNLVTFLISTSFLAYTVSPFVMLQFGRAFQLWREVYFFGHVLALLSFAVPYILPPEKKTQKNDRIVGENGYVKVNGLTQ